MSNTTLTLVKNIEKLTFSDLSIGDVFMRCDGTRTLLRVPRTPSPIMPSGGFNAVDMGNGVVFDVTPSTEVIVATEIKVFL